MASTWEEMKRRNAGTTEQKPVQPATTQKSAWETMKERALQREAAVPQNKSLPTNQAELMRMRQQAQIDLDVDTVSRIDNQLKAMRAAEGKQTVRDRVGEATGAAAAGYLGNVSNALGTVAENLGAKNFAQKAKGLADIADEDTKKFTENAKEGLGTMGQFAVDAGIMGGQMALDAAAGMLVPFGGMAAMGTRTFGGGAKAARDAGATQGQQLAYGAGSAALGILTEKIANVSGLFKGTYGKGLLDKVMNKVTAKPGGKLILSALSEGGEEMLESALDPLLQKLTYNPEAEYDEDWLAETLYSGALGAVLGGFGGSVDVVTGRGKTSAEAAETPKTTESKPLNLEGMTPERRKAFTQAQKIAERFGATLNVGTLENGAAGMYLNGQITIDANTENPVRQVLVHELTHHMETSGLYQDFFREIMDYMQRDMGIDLDEMRLAVMEDYAARGTALDSEGADRELVAKFAEDMLFRDEKAIRRLLEKDRNLFQRILDWIRTAKVRVKGTDEERFLMEAESLYERALQQAGTMEGSANAQNTFGGVNARTADLGALATAQQMEAQGMDADAIRKQTKWFRGMDGKWRFEIDDSGMKYFRSGDAAFTQNHPEYAEYQSLVNQMLMGTMTPEQEARMRELNDTWGREKPRLTDRLNGGAARLQDIIQHDALFEAYPELRNAYVRFAPMESERGQYDRRTNTITLNENIKNAPQDTIVHEVQHAIQQAEGFAGGAGTEYWEEVLRNNEPVQTVGLQQAEQKLMEFIRNPENAEAMQLQWMLDNAETDEDYQAIIAAAEQNGSYEKLAQYEQLQWDVEAQKSRANNMVPTELYRNTAGEIEARDTAYRREMTPEQRMLQVPQLGDENTVFAEEALTSKEFLGTTADGTEIYETGKETKSLSYKERMEKFLDIMENQFRGRTAKFTDGNQTYYAKFESDDLRKNIFGDKRSDKQGWKAKVNVGAEGNIFELVENATHDGSKQEAEKKSKAHKGVTGWEYFVKTVQIDGKVFDVLANVRKKPDGEYIYSIQLNENKNKAPAPLLTPAVNSNEMLDSRAQNRVLTDAYEMRLAQGETAVKDPYDIIPKLEKGTTPFNRGRLNTSDQSGGDAPSGSNVAQGEAAVNPYDIMPKLDGQFAQGRSFRDLQQKQQKATEEREQYVLDGEKDPYDIMPKLTATTIPVKAQTKLKETENALMRKIGRALSVPVGVQRSDLKELVRSISNEYLRDGTVSQESLNTLFEEAYERGIETDTEYYDQHKALKDTLRNTAITISAEDAANITDYNAFRKAAMGTLKIANNGTPVDVVYERLSEQDPALFPATITHPADQLQRMFEVGKGIQKVERTLNDYYGEDAATFKAWAKRDFNDAVNGALAELGSVRRFSEEAARKQAAKMTGSPEQVKAAYDNIRSARKKKERAVAKNLLTDSDNAQVSRLLKGEIQLKDINPKTNNVRGIKEVYEAKLEYEQLARVIREYKKNHSQKLRDEAEVLLKNSVNWKDKKAGMLYSRETMERNIRDIVPDKEVAERIIRKYFAPVHASQAAATRAKNDYRNRVKKLGLSRSVDKGNEVSEAHAVQLLGEAEDNIRMLENSTKKNPMRDGQTLQEWRLTVEKLKNNNPNMDWAKVNNAVNEFRAIYDELFQKMNEVRLRNGYEPVAYRQGYFPHFQPGETGLLASFGAALGITTDVTDLPTSINGMTHTFKPGITWFGHAQERKGFDTAYDAVQGFDKYIEGAADVIYQTDNIQNLRALANQIRYRAGDEGLKKQIDEINANENLTEDQKQAAVEQTHKEGGFALSNFVVELEEYTNLLANKKSRADRNMEQAMGRRMYNIIKGLEGRVAANMVAINPGSWLTNFIPITQGMASLDSKSLLRGMWDTLKAYKVDDGMVDMSTFLTNRRGSDPLVKTWAQDWSAKASKPMEWIDSFTADTLVRSRYNQNISEGMSVNEALDEADAWAAKVMADRSKGSTPTLFNRHNPLTKVFTQFQLEVNNQMSYLFKDVPDEMREKGLKALAVAIMKMFVGAYLYNEVYEHFVGRRPAMDPIGILVETGKNLANEDMDAYDVLVATGTEVAENLPFVGGLLGGGRLPISSALPNMENLGKAVFSDDWDEKKKRATIAKELTAPATYLLAPFGGGQIKKALQGAKAVKRGGSYTVNSKGEDVLQYPILSDATGGKVKDYAQAMIFGKSSLPEAKDWVQQGFNSLSGPETATYQELVKAGEDGRESFDILQELGDVEKTETESKAYLQRKALRDADLTDEGRSILFYNLLAGDKERELMDGANQKDREKAGDLLMNMKDADLHKGDTAKKAKYYALLESDVSDEMKIAVYNKYVTDSKEEEIRNMLDQGVKFNDWLQFEAKTGNLSSDDDATKKEKVIGALRDLNLSEDKKAAMYFASAATDSDKEKQQELEASSGITRTQYWQYQEATAGMSKKAEKLVAIDSLNLTPEQKTALYFANRWAESTLDEAPWYGSRWDITPKLTGTTQKNPFLAAPKLTGAPVLQKQNPFLKMPTL